MRNKYGLSRAIPVTIERRVREEAGWGCALCGNIFVELCHFDPPFALAESHSAEKLVALCPTCHKKFDAGEVSLAEIKQAKQHPFSRNRGFVSDYYIAPKSQPTVFFGGSTHFALYFKILVDGIPVLWIAPPVGEGRPCCLNAIFRRADFSPFLIIRNNTIIHKTGGTEIRKIGNSYQVSLKGECILSLSFRQGNIHIERANIFGIDSHIEANKSELVLSNENFQLFSASNFSVNSTVSYGRFPAPLSADIPASVDIDGLPSIINVAGKKLGYLYQQQILDLNLNIRAAVNLRGDVRRCFRRRDGKIVYEQPIGKLCNGLVLYWPQNEELYPILPIHFTLAHVVVSMLGNFPAQHLCISDFICSTNMPGALLAYEPFFVGY